MKGKQKKSLRARAHHLHPIVSIGGAGVTDAVVSAADLALADHELIKVRLSAGDKHARKAQAEELCERTNASLVQIIGRVLVMFRADETDMACDGDQT
ncbi:MAG: ribosome assembly RNA-binding protein YhbY [Gammaproteobacteria bacterium]|nr:MAG: ribosome assembly RNA-binding protein YhbY [Gammaproteobacteria bacterium]